MTDEKWADTIAHIKEKFPVRESGKFDLPEVPRGYVEFIVFDGPQGKMRLERTTQPVVLDKKTIYSKLAGSASKVEYVYSETEQFSKLRVYQWIEASGQWEKIKAAGSMFSS